jgi:hypothetical protein
MTRRLSRLARAASALAATGLALGLLPAATASASSDNVGAQLAQVRQVTEKFHNPDTAMNSGGYFPFLPCFDSAAGGMGQHFARVTQLDGTVKMLEPEILVYEPRSTGYKLVAVEYVVPIDAWKGSELPALFGRSFHAIPSLGVYALHAWIWRPNSAGIFADYNPDVQKCPA